MYDHLRAVTMIGAFFMYPDPRHCRRSVGSIEGARRCAKVREGCNSSSRFTREGLRGSIEGPRCSSVLSSL